MIICSGPHPLLSEPFESYSLKSCVEGFVFPYKGYSDEAVPLLLRIKTTYTFSLTSIFNEYSSTAGFVNNQSSPGSSLEEEDFWVLS